jgi:hypothetical protein
MPIVDTPGTWNVNIYAGATWRAVFTTGTATCTDARLQARQDVASETALVSLGTAAGLTIAAGTVSAEMSATATAALGSALGYLRSDLVYDLEVVESGGDVTRLAQGLFTVHPEITR